MAVNKLAAKTEVAQELTSQTLASQEVLAQELTPRTWLQLVFGILLMTFAGLIFAWSVFVEPIEQVLGFLRSQTSLVFAISLTVSILGQIFAGILKHKNRSRWSYLLAALLFALGFCAAAQIKTVYSLYLFYGVLVGFGIGVVYNAVIVDLVPLFPQRAGTVNGLLLMGFGLGSLLLGTLADELIRQLGWRRCFVIFAILFSLLALAGAFLIGSRGKDSLQHESALADSPGVSPKAMLKQASYQLFYFWNVFFATATFVIISHAALCVADLGASSQLAAWAVGAVSLASAAARLLFGHVYDQWGKAPVLILLSVVLLLGALASVWAYHQAFIGLLLCGYACIGLASGGGSILTYAYVREEYGTRYFGLNMGLTNTYIAAAGTAGSSVAGALQTAYGSYWQAMLFLLACALLSGVLAMALLRPPVPQ